MERVIEGGLSPVSAQSLRCSDIFRMGKELCKGQAPDRDPLAGNQAPVCEPLAEVVAGHALTRSLQFRRFCQYDIFAPVQSTLICSRIPRFTAHSSTASNSRSWTLRSAPSAYRFSSLCPGGLR